MSENPEIGKTFFVLCVNLMIKWGLDKNCGLFMNRLGRTRRNGVVEMRADPKLKDAASSVKLIL